MLNRSQRSCASAAARSDPSLMCACVQDDEPVLASHLHSCIVVHKHLEDSLAFILANKLCSPTLLPTNLMRLISDVYTKEPVRTAPPLRRQSSKSATARWRYATLIGQVTGSRACLRGCKHVVSMLAICTWHPGWPICASGHASLPGLSQFPHIADHSHGPAAHRGGRRAAGLAQAKTHSGNPNAERSPSVTAATAQLQHTCSSQCAALWSESPLVGQGADGAGR